MNCSKLEEYITILQTLLLHGPISLTEIESLIRIERFELINDLAFLLEQNAVTKKFSDESSAYVAAPLGVRLVKYFGLNPLMKK